MPLILPSARREERARPSASKTNRLAVFYSRYSGTQIAVPVRGCNGGRDRARRRRAAGQNPQCRRALTESFGGPQRDQIGEFGRLGRWCQPEDSTAPDYE
jgi:hypothetical protein